MHSTTRAAQNTPRFALAVMLSLSLATSAASQTPPDARGTAAPAGSCEDLALSIGENLEACEAQLASDRRLCERRIELEGGAREAAAQVRLNGAEQRILILTDALEASEAKVVREVWEHPMLWFLVGAAASAVVGAGAIAAVSVLRPAIPPVTAGE